MSKRFRDLRAHDHCECLHRRSAHYSPTGATGPCRIKDCSCPGFALKSLATLRGRARPA